MPKKTSMKMVTLDKAQRLLECLRKKYYFERYVDVLDVNDSLGRDLAQDVFSKYRSPKRNLATMDGYAIRCEDKYPLRIVDTIFAGADKVSALKKGDVVWIATGAPLPKGANAVLRLEDAKVNGDKLYGIPIKKWKYVIKAGTDYKKSEKILEKRRRIGPQEIAMLHSLGISKVRVYKKPKVAVFSTGDEITKGITKDTNAPMAMAFLKEWGCEPIFIGNVSDDLEETKRKILEGTKYDVVITSGGVSVGKKDYVTRAICELGELLLHKVMTRPGKPIAIGIVNKKPVFGLPGKPTGAFVATELCLKRFFLGKVPRPIKKCRIKENIILPTEPETMGSIYIAFVQTMNGEASLMGFEASPMKLFSSGDKYGVSIIASSPRSMIADGYIMTDKEIKKGDEVEVNLF